MSRVVVEQPGAIAEPPKVSRGRPRSSAADQAILAATLRVLATDGYQALTIESVAAAAGVGRPTVYRRYRSKAEMVSDALLALDAGPDPELQATTRDALLEMLHCAAASLAMTGSLIVLGSLLGEAGRDPALLATFRARVFGPRIAAVAMILDRGVAAAELAPGTDVEATIDLLFGALLARSLIGEPLDEAWLARVVECLYVGIAMEPSR